jgi:hypothetical protein
MQRNWEVFHTPDGDNVRVIHEGHKQRRLTKREMRAIASMGSTTRKGQEQ